jgi:1-acyl-sn-glycerol-3-phosphate acyltransferase
MKASAGYLGVLTRGVLGTLCRINAEELAKVPKKGPLIIVMNHINFLEVPLIYALLRHRAIVGMVKEETWKNPLIRILADSWEAIPIDRSGTDMKAMRKALRTLAEGRILVIAPEGTRSGHGRLQKGREGATMLAQLSKAPVLPVAHFGGERFWENLKRARRTRLTFRVGEPFTLKTPEPGQAKRARTEATDEIMGRIAILLPPEYRGVYSNTAGTAQHLAGY